MRTEFHPLACDIGETGQAVDYAADHRPRSLILSLPGDLGPAADRRPARHPGTAAVTWTPHAAIPFRRRSTTVPPTCECCAHGEGDRRCSSGIEWEPLTARMLGRISARRSATDTMTQGEQGRSRRGPA